MNKTHSQKYNDKLDKIFTPEIKRLNKRNEVAREILTSLNKMADIDFSGLQDWRIIDLIGRIIDPYIKNEESK